ncbi:hypothetical protein GCM10027615_38240 [Plantactinospora veratri]
MQPAAHPGVPGGHVGGPLSGDLRLPYRRTRVAAQAGDPANGLAEHPTQLTGPLRAVPGEPHVPVVRLVGHRYLEPDAEAADEVLALVAVEDEAVHHADAVAAGVEVEPDRERQPLPAPPSGPVPTVDPDHRPHRAALFDPHLVDLGGEPLLADGARLVLAGGVPPQADQRAVRRDGAVATDDRGHQHPTAPGYPAADDAGVHLDHPGGLGDPHRQVGCGGLAGAEQVVRGGWYAGADRVGGPLDRAVRPEPDRPGLHGYGRTGGGAQAEFLAPGQGAARPRHAPGRADQGAWRVAVEPAQWHPGVGVGGGGRPGAGRCDAGRCGGGRSRAGELGRDAGHRDAHQQAASGQLGHSALHFVGSRPGPLWKRLLCRAGNQRVASMSMR